MTVPIQCKRCGEVIMDSPPELILEHGVLKHNDQMAKELLSMLHSLRQEAKKIGGNTPIALEKELQSNIDEYFIRRLFKKLIKE